MTDSTISMTPVQPLNYLTKYEVIIGSELKSTDNITLNNEFDFEFYTLLDPSDKFPRISDEGLLIQFNEEHLPVF
ncbi:MAG: hypothetical protein IPP89_19040 [Saprospiraceae bacterium]|nr:hypothetical protein [Candidatus Brachybacter algidus]MBL0121003.1 hypothetical protein [Candidatus Brachybacter algidus]